MVKNDKEKKGHLNQLKSEVKSPDSPANKKEDDDLGRWRFAINIYELIINSPKDWSLRIAVYGAWGEGKTSVLKFIEQMALNQKHVVAWFNPWEAQDREELWTDFATSIYDAIEKAGIEIPSKLKNRVRKLAAIIGDPINKVAKIDNRLNVAAGILRSPLRRWLSVKEGEVGKIPKLLEDKRLIVMIDDLDRAAPDIIPNLLLSLRELLDIPSFIFILAFDPDVVSHALLKQHPGWKSGYQFIDKIIDFPFWLPTLNRYQLNEFSLNEFKRSCDFVDLQSVESILDLIPSNPRKLKQYIRNLWYLKPELERHEENEMNWTSILINQLLKIEFPSLFERIMNSEEILYNLSSIWITMPPEKDPLRDEEEEKPDYIIKIDKIISEAGIEDKNEKLRATELLIALGRRTSFMTSSQIHYYAKFGTHPHAVTWKEYMLFYNNWRNNPNSIEVSHWLEDHINLREEDPKKVFNEIFETTINYRLKLIEEAADAHGLAEMRSKAKEAIDLLTLLHQLCFELKDLAGVKLVLGIDHFCKLQSMIEKWFHFRNDLVYRQLRQTETIFMIEYVENAQSISNKIFKTLKPWNFRPTNPIEPPLIGTFRCELATIAQDFIVRQLLQRFEQPNGIKDLWGEDRRVSEKYILFRIESPIWDDQNQKIFFGIANRANRESFIHENFLEFIRMLAHFSKEGLETLSPDEVKKLAQDINVVEAAWKAAVARPIQPRMIGSFKKFHKDLKNIAGTDKHLPEPAFFSVVTN